MTYYNSVDQLPQRSVDVNEPQEQPSAPEFSERSFYCLDLKNPFRRFAISTIKWTWFERFSMMVIAANCFALGSADPCDIHCLTGHCQIMQVLELFIFLFFLIEMIIKMIAMGVFGEKSYLSETWNRLDLFIVLAGLTEYIFANHSDVNLSAIRAFRVLRPLRAINRISSLRLLVNLLLDILPMLGHVMVLCLFIFFLFGTVSVQLWSGVLRHRCFFPESVAESPPAFMPPFYQKAQEDFVCSSSSYGMFRCSDIPRLELHDGSMCFDLFGHDPAKLEICKEWVGNYTECLPFGPNPSRGTVNFDNIGYASIAIFQVISLEGWSAVMYLVQDSYTFWVWIYFITLVLLGSYLAVNLCLVVIAAQFSVTKSQEKLRLRKERLEAARLQGLSATSLDLSNIGSSNEEQAGLYLQILNLLIHYLRIGYRWLRSKIRSNSPVAASRSPPSRASNRTVTKSSTMCEKCRAAPASSYRPLEKPLDLKQVSFELEPRHPPFVNRCQLCAEPLPQSLDGSRANSVEQNQSDVIEANAHQNGPVSPLPVNTTLYWTTLENVRHFRHTSRAWLKRALDSQLVLLFLQMLILINAIIMACEHHDQPVVLTELVEITNAIFTFVFLIELIAKVYSYGLEEFIREGFNLIDASIIIINLVELFQSGQGSGFAVLRLFRLVRIVKIVRFLPALQQQLLVMIHTVDNVATFFLLLMFFLFISALLGMSLFGCRFCTLFRNPLNQMLDTAGGKTVAGELTLVTVGKCRYVVAPFPEQVAEESNLMLGEENATINGTEAQSPDNTVQLLECPVANFDNLGQALFTVLQVFTQDDWGAIMKNAMHSTSDWAALYFIALVTLGNYIIFNLLVAILVEGFSSKSEEAIMRANSKATTNKINVNSHPSLERGHTNEEKPSYLPGPFRRILRCFVDAKKIAISCWNGNGTADDYSFYIFKYDNVLRVHLKKAFTSNTYETVLLLFIIASCFLIALENPKIEKHSLERYALTGANYAINLAFFCEFLGKSIAFGFLLGNNAYLRSGWNMLDFFLITIVVVDVSLDILDPNATSKKVLQVLRVLRLLRALRPLRMISKARGLKIVIETLAESMKPIGNIILICCFFFCIFSILGVQLFRGCFARCVPSKHIPQNMVDGFNFTRESYAKWAMETISRVSNRSECLSYQLEWETESYNFDSLPEALMALFVFSTLDGWADITRNGVACVGVNQQPMPNYNPWNFLYFSAFLLIVCFFALNMFVGVVVNNFQKVQHRFEIENQNQKMPQQDSKLLLRNIYRRVSTVTILKVQSVRSTLFGQKSGGNKLVNRYRKNASARQRVGLVKQKAVEDNTQAFQMRTDAMEFEEDAPFWMDYPPWRLGLYQFVSHNYFDIVMTAATAINVVSMAFEFHNMPNFLYMIFKVMGFCFLGLIIVETSLKFVALGMQRYWSDGWNKMDLSILIISIVATVLEEIDTEQLPINPSIIRIARIFRIARVLKLWRAATGVRKLLKTVSSAIPQVGNLSVLFLLLFFIYASLGVELYGRFDCKYGECDGLSRHANFRNFGTALLTLFRIFTGDDWNGILKDILRMSDSEDACATSADGISCYIVHTVSPLYFVSFVLLAQFVLINVVVAVLMVSFGFFSVLKPLICTFFSSIFIKKRQIEDAHKEPSAKPLALPQSHGNFASSANRRVKETCFIDGSEYPTSQSSSGIVKVQQIDKYSDDYLIMRLDKIARGCEDLNDIEEETAASLSPGIVVSESEPVSDLDSELIALRYNAGSTVNLSAECVVIINEQAMADQQTDDNAISSADNNNESFSCADNSNHSGRDYAAIEQTWRAMDNQLIRRLNAGAAASDDSEMVNLVSTTRMPDNDNGGQRINALKPFHFLKRFANEGQPTKGVKAAPVKGLHLHRKLQYQGKSSDSRLASMSTIKEEKYCYV